MVMRTIKIKNKYLIILVAAILLFGVVIPNLGGDVLFSLAERNFRKSNSVKALAYYNKLIERYPHHRNIPEALYHSAMLLPSEADSMAMVFSDNWSYSHSKVDEEKYASLLSKEERLWRLYNDYPNHLYTRDAEFYLAEILDVKGDAERAIELYLNCLQNEEAQFMHRESATHALINLFLRQKDTEKARWVYEYYKANVPNVLSGENPYIQMAYGDILLAEGNKEGAKEAYDKALELYYSKPYRTVLLNDGPGFPVGYTPMETANYYRMQIEHNLGAHDLRKIVAGQVTLNGEPLSGIEVLLWPRPVDGAVFSSRMDDKIVQVTDINGEFVFSLSPELTYQVGIKLNRGQMERFGDYYLSLKDTFITSDFWPEKVEISFIEPVKLKSPQPGTVLNGGQFTVEWEPYPKASFYLVSIDPIYKVQAGSMFHNGFSYYTEDTSVTFSKIPFLFGIVPGSNQGIHPGYFTYPDAVRVVVSACDENGVLLAKNTGLPIPPATTADYVYNVEAPLKHEEQLLAELRFDQAVESLEHLLRLNENDAYALGLLAKIYATGTHYLDTNYRYRANQDVDRAIELMERLVAIDPSSENLELLGNLYGRVDNPKQYELFHILEERGELLPKYYGTLGENYLWNEDDYKKAIQYYLFPHSLSMADKFLFQEELVGLYLLLGKPEEAIALVDGRDISSFNRDRLVDLLSDYAAYIRSGEDIYLSVLSDSFLECRRIWQETDTAHARFLYIVSEMIHPERFDLKEELRDRISSFGATYGKSHPQLSNLLHVLADLFLT